MNYYFRLTDLTTGESWNLKSYDKKCETVDDVAEIEVLEPDHEYKVEEISKDEYWGFK